MTQYAREIGQLGSNIALTGGFRERLTIIIMSELNLGSDRRQVTAFGEKRRAAREVGRTSRNAEI